MITTFVFIITTNTRCENWTMPIIDLRVPLDQLNNSSKHIFKETHLKGDMLPCACCIMYTPEITKQDISSSMGKKM